MMQTKRQASSANKILTIRFDGPYRAYSETKDVLADCKHRKSGGVYFWAIKVNDSFRISHIGQTGTSFYQRMKEHIISTLGGNYRICDAEAAARGDMRVLWDGMWREGTRGRLPEFLRQSTQLLEAAKRNLKLENIFVAPVDIEDRMRRRIEGAIAKHVRKDKVASSLLPPDIRVLGRLTMEAPIPVRIVAPVKILGLPEQLDV